MSFVRPPSSVRWNDLTHSFVADAKTREAWLITPLVAAANTTLLGIGGVFWGLVIGLMAYAGPNGRLPRRALKSVMAPIAVNQDAS